MRVILAILFVSIYFTYSVPSLALPKHSTVTHTIENKPNGDIIIHFKVTPNEGLVINDDENSPWMVQLRKATGLAKESYDAPRSEFDNSIPGFKLTAKLADPKKPTFRCDTRLVAFVCTADKSRCFRDVHKFTIDQTSK